MSKLLALWAHPRSLSTAFCTVMQERGDCTVIHEPFAYLYYFDVNTKDQVVPVHYKDEKHPMSYADIKQFLYSKIEAKPIFFKDMPTFCFDSLIKDDGFLKDIRHAFIIRNPKKSIPSLYALYPELKMDYVGYENLYRLYEKIVTLCPDKPLVIQAEELASQPEVVMQRYCNYVGIPFIKESLHWKSGMRPEWELAADFHAKVAASHQIHKSESKYEDNINTNADQRKLYDHHLKFYEKLLGQS